MSVSDLTLEQEYFLLKQELSKTKEALQVLMEANEHYISNESWCLEEYFTRDTEDNWILTGGKRARQAKEKCELIMRGK